MVCPHRNGLGDQVIVLFVCHACTDPGDLHDGIIDRKLDKMAAKVDTLDPVTSVARGGEWDAQTVHSWLAANTRGRGQLSET